MYGARPVWAPTTIWENIMSLLDVRRQFVEISGRYDLVDDPVNWSDKGADFYIQSGQKYLERLVTVPENTATIFLPLAAGEYSLTFQYSIRSIQEVFVNDSEQRIRLDKVSLRDLKETYYKTVSDTTTGGPTHYALANLRALETTAKDSLGTFINNTHDESDTKYDYRGIIIVPPADGSYVVEVTGLFQQTKLTADADENYWTTSAPELLLKAALYQLEVFSRGTGNARNYLSALQAELAALEMDWIEEDIAEIDNMKG
jgi:hypothetical protein